MHRIAALLCGFGLISFATLACGQQTLRGSLDPARTSQAGKLQSSLHTPLPENYIWTNDPADPTRPRFFRVKFPVASIPPQATLYLSGPKRVTVFLNGNRIGDFHADPTAPISPAVYHVDLSRRLQAGTNVLAIRAVVATKAATWSPETVYTHGSLVAKIVPAAYSFDRPPILISDAGWKASLTDAPGWESAAFDDSKWEKAKASGTIEGHIDRFQWNGDAGLYRWPGYDGISPFLMRLPVAPVEIKEVFEGGGRIENVASLTSTAAAQKPFTIHLPAAPVNAHEAPSFVLDFGREINGRLEVVSDSPVPVRMTVAYGESMEEAVKKPYLGTNEMYIAPGQTGHGPKSAFRYAKLQFFGEGAELRFKAIRVDDIYYPVEYRGSFESSDPVLNRIWETGAHTAHLCMQDDIWDAPKRDRGRWMGDLHVIAAIINDVFLDRFLMEDTLQRLNPVPVQGHVNGIPGYSAWWIIGLNDYYRHTGALPFIQSLAPNLRDLLKHMEGDLDERALFVNRHKSWPFVDWSPKMQQEGTEAYRATHMEYYRAFIDGAYLLRETGDQAAAEHYAALAGRMKQAAHQHLLENDTNTFGSRWQTNSAAIYTGVADERQTAAIRNQLFATIDTKNPAEADTPYYHAYVITAMAMAGERQRALDWIRKYWGGMVSQGATSFWEGYNLDWPKEDFHATLKADDGMGYFVSLSHGWSGGPTWWLTEQVLGVQPTAPGFKQVMIRPDLLDLEYVRGVQPTPAGSIAVEARKSSGETIVELPAGIEALIAIPVVSGSSRVSMNGTARDGQLIENGKRVQVRLTDPGRYVLRSM